MTDGGTGTCAFCPNERRTSVWVSIRDEDASEVAVCVDCFESAKAATQEAMTDGDDSLPNLRDELPEEWRDKAEENVEEWGTQTPAEILLAMQEELGELTQAVLEADYESEPAERAEDELDDLGALLFQLDDALADYFYEIHDERDGELATDGGHERPKFAGHGLRNHGSLNYDYYSCPSCDETIATLCDCPECGWYDEDLWREAIREAVQVHGDVWTGDVSVETATDGGRAELPHRGTSHYNDDSDEDDETVYERADKVVRRCRGDLNKYCAWSMSYEGDELDAILKDNGCIDADAVDRRCPLCGGPVGEDYFGLDAREGVPK
jgi:NTP pyrophosphatase (non-canonical NTP hydrolase)